MVCYVYLNKVRMHFRALDDRLVKTNLIAFELKLYLFGA